VNPSYLALAFMLVLVVPVGWAYSNRDFGFSIDPPQGWNLTESPYVVALFMDQSSTGFAPRLSIDVLDRVRTDIEEVISQLEATYRSMFTNLSILERLETTLGGLEVRILVCTWVQGIHDVKMKEVVIRNGNRYYDLAYIATRGDYDKHLAAFEESVGSISFTDSIYENPDLGLDLVYPSGWALDEGSIPGAAIFYGPEEAGFLTNVVLLNEPWSGDLEGYVEDQKSKMAETMTELEMVEEGNVTIGDFVGSMLVYTYQMPGPLDLKSRMDTLVKGGRALNLVYTSRADRYWDYLPCMESMMKSLEIDQGPILPVAAMGFALSLFVVREF